MNQQAPENVELGNGAYLEVHSIFRTIQGEGPFAGDRAIFVRLAGCNLQCPGCDTDYTSNRNALPIDQIVSSLINDFAPTELVVITGGEPFRQNIAPFVSMLLQGGFVVQIETNGTLYRDLPWGEEGLFVVCSPKTGKINPRLAEHISDLKYVLDHDSIDPTDGLPIQALDHPNSGRLARSPAGFSGTIYLQPADRQDDAINRKNVEACIQSCMDYGYTFGLQMHKIIGLE